MGLPGRPPSSFPSSARTCMEEQPIRGYQFAAFTLDLPRRRLSGTGPDALPLSGRAFEVLAYLLAPRDRMVPKRELMDAVWPHMVVEENNLTQAISTLRRVLGDTRESPQFIATVAGRGYQFVGDASPFHERAPETFVAAAAAPESPPAFSVVTPTQVEPMVASGERPAGVAPLSRRKLLI